MATQFTMHRTTSFADLPRWLQRGHRRKSSLGRLWWEGGIKGRWKLGTPDGVKTVMHGDVINMGNDGDLHVKKE